jgi:transcriptional regulator with XRE-family HTH domain
MKDPKVFRVLKGEYPIKNYRLAQARVESGMTVEILAELVGVSKPAMGSYESLRSRPDKIKQKKISEVLGRPVEYLFPEGYELSRMKRDAYFLSRNQLNSSILIYEKSWNDGISRIDRELTDFLSGTLSKREDRVLRLSFGFKDGKDYNFTNIGERIGVTRERARQIFHRAMAKLRENTRLKKFYEDIFCQG